MMAMMDSFLEGVVPLTVTMTTTALPLILIVTLVWWLGTARPPGFPPGPRGLPLLGSILAMTASPEEIFSRWSKLYGDVIGFRAGQRWMVAINHEDAIREALIKQGLDFAGRPDFFSFDVFTYGFKDLIFSTYSDTWKVHHKHACAALRHFASGKRLEVLLHSSISKLDDYLSVRQGNPVDPKLMITLLLYNIMSTMCFGKEYDFLDKNLVSWMEDNERLNKEFGMGVAADFFPWARFIPSPGVKMVHRMRDELHRFVWEELGRHKENFNPDNLTDFFDMLLLAQKEANEDVTSQADQWTDTHIVLTVSNMFAAGIQTTTETLYWGLAFMAEYQDIQSKVQVEIDSVIGADRFPVLADRGSVPYTEATVNEIMRFSSILPVAVPHATTGNVDYRGYRIPKGTVVMLNTYSMHFDPRVWESPELFKPEHFLDESGTVRLHPPSFMPFGAGRRSCLGESVAKADLFLIFTWLMQNYTFSKVSADGSGDSGPEQPNTRDLPRVIKNSAVGRNLENYKLIIQKRV